MICRAGRRSGKTTGLAIRAVKRFLDGKRVLYAAPTYDQTDRFWVEVKRMLMPLVDAGVLRLNETTRLIEVPGTENRIRAKTAWNANTLRGDYADELILDEWQLMDENAWDEVGAPMLLDNDGDAVFLYTPPSLASRGQSKAKDRRHAAKMFKAAQDDPDWDAIHFTSHSNPHISARAIGRLTSRMSALAIRQEIDAEDIEEVPGALWTRDIIRYVREEDKPDMVRVVVAVDPTGSLANPAGIVVAGLGTDGLGYVLADLSDAGLSPDAWARRAVTAYYDYEADRIVAERNYGGDMVEATVKVVDPLVPYRDVNATRGKARRAEPVSALYEKDATGNPENARVYHVGEFPELEEEYCSWTQDATWSPNRLDAAVWALTDLLLQPQFVV